MTDFEIMEDTELMVCHIEGSSDAAIEFIDSWYVAEMVVVDSGRIILPASEARPFLEGARAAGLSWSAP